MNLLYEPFSLGNIELRNRIVLAPMSTGLEENGMVTARTLAFYRRLALGGVGLILYGDCAVQPHVTPAPALYDARFVPGLRRLVDEVHSAGARIGAQLALHEYDAVEVLTTARGEGRDAALKKVREDYLQFASRASLEQIRRLQDLFVSAALRAQEAGFDLVQIQGDRLVGMFCSPILNRRADEYGGSLENRMRFALEVVAKIRAAAPALHIDYRLALVRADPATGGQTLLGKGGPTLEEAGRAAPWLVQAGAGSFLVCPANHGDIRQTIPPAGAAPYACFADLAAVVRQAAGVPVAAGGCVVRPAVAERMLSQGKADLVALARPLLCDPAWALKAEEGRAVEIRECILCNRCLETMHTAKPVACAINAQTGPGVELEIRPAARPRRVLVIGGGPAGMEAARVAALRGHHVTLVERERSLGGQARLAAQVPGKEEMKRLLAFLMGELPRLSVDVRLGMLATAALVRELSPDVVIVAAGAAPPPAPRGLEDDETPTALVDAWDVLRGADVPGSTVIIAGGGRVGLETARLLAAQGKTVTVMEAQAQAGAGLPPAEAAALLASLKERGVRIQTGTRVVSLLSDGVVMQEAGGEPKMVTAGGIVKAYDMRRPERALLAALRQEGLTVRAVGDCAGDHARLLSDAIHEGFRAALEIE